MKEIPNDDNFIKALGIFGPVSAVMGKTWKETVTVLSLFSAAKIDIVSSAIAFRSVIISLHDLTPQKLKILESVGLAGEDVDPEIHSYMEIINVLSERINESLVAFKLFGMRQFDIMMRLFDFIVKIKEEAAFLFPERKNEDKN